MMIFSAFTVKAELTEIDECITCEDGSEQGGFEYDEPSMVEEI